MILPPLSVAGKNDAVLLSDAVKKARDLVRRVEEGGDVARAVYGVAEGGDLVDHVVFFFVGEGFRFSIARFEGDAVKGVHRIDRNAAAFALDD